LKKNEVELGQEPKAERNSGHVQAEKHWENMCSEAGRGTNGVTQQVGGPAWERAPRRKKV